jgi:type I restriction enzyme S subunit
VPDVDTEFLYWLTRDTNVWPKRGSAQPFISQGDARAMQIAYPSLAEQKGIAAVLGALDDKIELNLRINATLEPMARALFQSWFVDFDPVRAKLEGRHPFGLAPGTATLFPDTFQESVVGRIPHGWKLGVLDELTSFVIGGDWGAAEPTDDETISCYCIRGADIPSLQGGGVGKMPTRFLKPSSVERRQLLDGDLAIEISGGSPTQCTGRPVLISDDLLRSLGKPLVASNFCRIVKLKSPMFSKFVYCWLRRLYDAGDLFQFETGTTGIKNFAFVIFSEKYPLVIPDPRVAEAFDRAVSPLFACIQANAQQSRTLVSLRETLLPKLLSGELKCMRDVAVNPN